MRTVLALAIGKILRFLVRLVRKGGGSALPGLLVSKLHPRLLQESLAKFPDGLVVVTGSAGKSTTTKMLVAIVRAHGHKVFTNPSTANILQGFYSSIVERANLFGRLPGSVAILEMDEAHAEELTRTFAPRQVTVLNVMEDQLDRFVDPALVRNDLGLVASRALEKLVLNRSDPNIRLMHKEHPGLVEPVWFGVDKASLATEKHGLATAPVYEKVPAEGPVFGQVQSLDGMRFDAKIGNITRPVLLPNRGLHFAVDAIAALTSAKTFLGDGFDFELAAETLNALPPVFARGEITQVRGMPVEFNLVQNPGSMQLNLDNLGGQPDLLFFAIGRDVHDPSWLWTVDYSSIKRVDVVAGFNAAEAALVLRYNDIEVGRVIYDLDEAIDYFFSLPAPQAGPRTVVFSADVMRRMRRALGFWSPEEVSR